MAEPQRVGPLDINEDPAFERRQLRVQHVGWGILLVIVLAAVLGAFGNGPLSHAQATSGPLTLDYEWQARQHAPTELRLRIVPETSTVVPVWIERAFLETVDNERIVPEPLEAAVGEDRIIYRIALADPAQPATIVIAYQPARPGQKWIRLGMVGGAELDVGQFVFP